LKLLWSNVALAAEQHPKLVLTLTVYTLSLDRAWLIV
jgi:MSHA biogenesis protein MshJ